MKIKALISTTLAASLAASVMALSASAASFTKTADVGVNHFDMGHVSGTVSFAKTSFTSGTKLVIDFEALLSHLKEEALDAGALDKSKTHLALANVTLNGAPVNGTDSKTFSVAGTGNLTFGLSSDSGNIASGNYTQFTFGLAPVILDSDGKVDKDETQKLAEYLKEEAKEFDRAVSIKADGGKVYGNDDTLTGPGATDFTQTPNKGVVTINKIKYDGLQTGDAGVAAEQIVKFDFRSNVSDNEKFTTAEKAVLRNLHTVELDLGIRGASTTGNTVKVTAIPREGGVDEQKVIAYSVVPKGATTITIPITATEFYDAKYGDIFDGQIVIENGNATNGVGKLKFTAAKLLFADNGGSTSGGDVSGLVDSEASSQLAATSTPASASSSVSHNSDEPIPDDEPIDTEVSEHVETEPEIGDGGFDGGDADTDHSGAGTNTAGGGADTTPGNNPPTGVALAIAPALIAGAAVVFSRKKK